MEEFGCYMGWLVMVMVCIVGDIIAGIIQAVINKNVKSGKMKEGLWRKGAEVFLVFFVAVVNIIVSHWGLLAAYEPLRQLFEFTSIPLLYGYIAFKEFTSIGENLCKANKDLTDLPLFQYLAKAQEINGGGDGVQ